MYISLLINIITNTYPRLNFNLTLAEQSVNISITPLFRNNDKTTIT